MDPMDFTMDEAQASHHSPNAAHRHQCQPSQSSNTNSFGSPHIRDGPPYDPVYDSSTWYHANNVPSRGPYNAPEHVHWGASPFLPTPNWQSHGLAEHSGGQDPTAFRQSRFMGMPWNEMRAFDPPGFGFNSYTSPPNSNNATSDSTGGSAQAATGPRVPSTYGQEAHARSVRSFSSPPFQCPASLGASSNTGSEFLTISLTFKSPRQNIANSKCSGAACFPNIWSREVQQVHRS